MGILPCKLGCPLLTYMATVGSTVGNSVGSPLISSMEIVGSSVGSPLTCALLNLNWKPSLIHMQDICSTCMHIIVNDLKSVFTEQTKWTSCILNIVQHDIATFKLIKWYIQYVSFTSQCHLRYQSKFRLHLSPTLIHFNQFASLNSMHAEQNAWAYIFILSSIQYIYIPASNITTQLLVFCCGIALEPDFLTIFPKMNDPLLCSYIYLDAWRKPMLELPIAHYFLSVKTGAAHWAAHYVIWQSELPMGSPW